MIRKCTTGVAEIIRRCARGHIYLSDLEMYRKDHLIDLGMRHELLKWSVDALRVAEVIWKFAKDHSIRVIVCRGSLKWSANVPQVTLLICKCTTGHLNYL